MIKLRKFNELGNSGVKYKITLQNNKQFHVEFIINKEIYIFTANAFFKVKDPWAVGLAIKTDKGPSFVSHDRTQLDDQFKVLSTTLKILNDFLVMYKPIAFELHGKEKSLKSFLQQFAEDIEKYVSGYSFDRSKKRKDMFGTYYRFNRI